jgi:hypothetical protein
MMVAEAPMQPTIERAVTPVGPVGRRMRDRLVERESHRARPELANLLLLIDDDLRETADAMTGIERFLGHALALLDGEQLEPAQLLRLCADGDVMERIDTLGEALTTLRRRFGALAATVG